MKILKESSLIFLSLLTNFLWIWVMPYVIFTTSSTAFNDFFTIQQRVLECPTCLVFGIFFPVITLSYGIGHFFNCIFKNVSIKKKKTKDDDMNLKIT